jgi:hypothetical protein
MGRGRKYASWGACDECQAPSWFDIDGVPMGWVTIHRNEICPKCKGKGKVLYPPDSRCYIATAAYGSPYAAEVDTFRYFRDTVLVRSYFGRAFIAFYYKTSPPLADFIAEREYLKAATRNWLLAPLLHFLRKK